MRAHDARAAGQAAAEGADVLISLVRDTHRGISDRVFRSIGPGAAPVRMVHNAIAGLVYEGLGAAGRTAPAAAAEMAARLFDGGAAWDETPRGAAFLAALNGIYGDELHDRENGFAGSMSIRVRRRAVEPQPGALAAAFGAATGRIAVLVHGLCMSEDGWRRDGLSYADGLTELGFTPVHLRYNTGRHISSNGRDLDALLTALVSAWPVPIEEIVLIGHSMGGLVIRSACHSGQQSPWAPLVGHIVCLGSPHLGADLEKGVNAASWALARIPETRAVAQFLNRRSDGIKDLRYGALVDDDWSGADPDELLSDRCTEIPLLPGARYHVVVTTAAGPKVVGAVLGDYLVATSSASGLGRGGRSVPFVVEDGMTVAGANHLELLYHPGVDLQLRQWLAA